MLLWVLLLFLPLLALLFHNPYLFQDVQYVLTKLRSRRRVKNYVRTNFSILDRFVDAVKAQPHKSFVRFKEETFSFQDADELSSRAARVLLQSGRVERGDTVALFLPNEPMFLWLFLGLMKIGCSAAFLNHNVRSRSLLHCFSCSGAKVLVASAELQDAVDEVLPRLLEQQVTVFILADKCKTAETESFTDRLSQASSEPIPKDLRSHVTLRSPAIYIYTSGTTGLPKAAPVTHSKLWAMTLFFASGGVNSRDVIYISLPLYHTTAFLGFTLAIEKGLTVALRSKFSASQFWTDCVKYDVTVVQYVGEIMRYLCNTPETPADQSHRVRLALGNGMRADVWKDFINRFGNIEIREFYGATEGNFSLMNYGGKAGALGRASFLHERLFPHSLIRYDVDTGTPLRDSAGFCIDAPKGEPGLLVCEISVNAPFAGYAGDLQQTEKKRLLSVHQEGDVYFNTGDVLSVDEDDFIYFHDRVGDTFRWKGENVSTAEVADVVALADCVSEANVYGVKVPGVEGRAGMAAVALPEGQRFEPVSVFQHVQRFLPAYARPCFIRIQGSLVVTGTFKYLKVKLVEEGFDPNTITDPLYFLDDKEKNYVPLTPDVFSSITSGTVKM